ncbi:hypothetical protein BgiBS90_028429 [Biomphalaria glabrata]|nr:hypothetical protein BgiBS90_028429 [Biomphalaria glabrata]
MSCFGNINIQASTSHPSAEAEVRQSPSRLPLWLALSTTSPHVLGVGPISVQVSVSNPSVKAEVRQLPSRKCLHILSHSVEGLPMWEAAFTGISLMEPSGRWFKKPVSYPIGTNFSFPSLVYPLLLN